MKLHRIWTLMGALAIGSLGLVGCDSDTDEPGGSGASSASGGKGGTTNAGGNTASGGNTSSGQGGDAGGAGGVGGQGGVFENKPECTKASQCNLINDCCNCKGIPSSEQPPVCDVPECFAPMCEALDFPNLEASCAAGRCVAGFDCDHTKVQCKSIQPECDPGKTPTVVNNCWGQCVPAEQCGQVGNCKQCGPDQVCVNEVTQLGFMRHCVNIPKVCKDKVSCACMGASVCVAPYDNCSEANGTLSCDCPAC